MRFRFCAIATSIIFVFLTAHLFAHHSLQKTHDLSRTVTLTGVVSSVEWLNPHARLNLDVRSANGGITTWEIELAAPNTMIRYGLAPAVLKPGDQISVDVWIAKDSSLSGSAQALKLSDGRTAYLAAPWNGQAKR
jgi:hypothetical protein